MIYIVWNYYETLHYSINATKQLTYLEVFEALETVKSAVITELPKVQPAPVLQLHLIHASHIEALLDSG